MATPARQRILDAALGLIQQRGIGRVTTREIAMAAGTAEGSRPGTPYTSPPVAPRPRRPAHRNGYPNRPGVNPQHAQQAPIVTDGSNPQGCPK